MEILRNRKVVLGITGSIAAYKAVEILRKLQKAGAEVKVAMTPSASKFISTLTLQTISGYPVYLEAVPENSPEIRHTSLSSWGELFIVAPATANTISKIAHGIADTSVTNLALCFGKGIICPAMNVRMYENPVTQKNLEILKNLGYEIVEPDSGYLACREKGKGRLAEVEDILDAAFYWFIPKLLKGKRVVVTAGATREYIDPVRFLSNPSSGKMGFELAKAARGAGAEVTLITGKTQLRTPYDIKRIDVETVEEMKEAVLEATKDVDIYISAAAIGDYRPIKREEKKIKKSERKLILELERTPDILKLIGEGKRNGQIVIGFAAETDNLVENARKKIEEKNLDAIVANDVKKGIFGSDKTEISFITKKGEFLISGSKEEVSIKIVQLIYENFFKGVEQRNVWLF
ncbi:bifunctional phosphopantothenoylcysteine decarboxylase/phosphopantothenate--cysteine ligase CoaBC [Desulfurobacterium thermolithotrophum]|uniref:bifunctional phosphopantothenoylcysteine decarboxylase/phosphopantothenate--cysteine ligase CoaBC n=1 Tax=Desulfurobacterium thermolithotrophum TaxID=64160 RepID=UPI0013D79699|nr:bifunctional phosphopantothenoylcysteine decarboxylase/phosphopantothenate--cysteine ligase CoaBC [Desulfurobacterium thermolithotrophum]